MLGAAPGRLVVHLRPHPRRRARRHRRSAAAPTRVDGRRAAPRSPALALTLRARGRRASPSRSRSAIASRSARRRCARSASFGFSGYVAGWTQSTVLVVLPAALRLGRASFPLLVALSAAAAPTSASQVGLAYAWNTAGRHRRLARRRLRPPAAPLRARLLAARRRSCSPRSAPGRSARSPARRGAAAARSPARAPGCRSPASPRVGMLFAHRPDGGLAAQPDRRRAALHRRDLGAQRVRDWERGPAARDRAGRSRRPRERRWRSTTRGGCGLRRQRQGRRATRAPTRRRR